MTALEIMKATQSSRMHLLRDIRGVNLFDEGKVQMYSTVSAP